MPAQKKKANPKPKSKSWKPHDPPPMDDLDDYDSSSDEEEGDAEGMDATLAQDPPLIGPEVSTSPPNS